MAHPVQFYEPVRKRSEPHAAVRPAVRQKGFGTDDRVLFGEILLFSSFGGRILQSLNLKNPKAYLLASELSCLTGESLTSAVISALEFSLQAEKNKLGGPGKAEDIMAFARRFSPKADLKIMRTISYDENGMPA